MNAVLFLQLFLAAAVSLAAAKRLASRRMKKRNAAIPVIRPAVWDRRSNERGGDTSRSGYHSGKRFGLAGYRPHPKTASRTITIPQFSPFDPSA